MCERERCHVPFLGCTMIPIYRRVVLGFPSISHKICQWPEWDPCRERVRNNRVCYGKISSAEVGYPAVSSRMRPSGSPRSTDVYPDRCQCWTGLSLIPLLYNWPNTLSLRMWAWPKFVLGLLYVIKSPQSSMFTACGIAYGRYCQTYNFFMFHCFSQSLSLLPSVACVWSATSCFFRDLLFTLAFCLLS